MCLRCIIHHLFAVIDISILWLFVFAHRSLAFWDIRRDDDSIGGCENNNLLSLCLLYIHIFEAEVQTSLVRHGKRPTASRYRLFTRWNCNRSEYSSYWNHYCKVCFWKYTSVTRIVQWTAHRTPPSMSAYSVVLLHNAFIDLISATASALASARCNFTNCGAFFHGLRINRALLHYFLQKYGKNELTFFWGSSARTMARWWKSIWERVQS